MRRINYISFCHFVSARFLWLFLLVMTACSGKRNKVDYPAPIHKYILPQFDLVKFEVTDDTLHFLLEDDAYSSVKSFNLITWHGKDYISFFDERSMVARVYDLIAKQKIKSVSIKAALGDRKIYKPAIYVHTLDSIFVCNNKAVYIIDSSGTIMSKMPFLKEPDLPSANFDNDIMPVFKNGSLFTSVRLNVNEESLSALKKWQVLYEFDFKKRSAKLHYTLPALLQQQYYGEDFLDHSYCYNDQGHFVFSFRADSAIYETDLANYHMAYSGKSFYQHAVIPPLSKEELKADDSKPFKIRDSYGSIYFDPIKKRYLRVAFSKVTEQEYANKKPKAQRLIIFDDQFKIIGESSIDNSISLKSLFITSSGNIYARVNRKDEYALHFVRLAYIDNNNEHNQIAKYEGNSVP